MSGDLFQACRGNGPYRPLSRLRLVHLDLRYAGPFNLCGHDLYHGEREAWLHHEALDSLELACVQLARLKPGWKLRVYDAIRPLSVQRLLFDKVAGTPQQAYVAHPAQGSVHNYGFAVDLGLEDSGGLEQDLGTPFDSFDPLAQPQLETAFQAQGRLNQAQVEARQLLRQVMEAGNYQCHPMEWWHFDRRPLDQLKGIYPILST